MYGRIIILHVIIVVRLQREQQIRHAMPLIDTYQ